MGILPSGHPLLTFGGFELDLQSNQLRCQGRLVPLQSQPLKLLVLLLQKPQSLVTREEIRQELWPADTFVEFNDSVNHAVRKLREALNDTAERPRFVETVPRRGYRFLAPVQTVPAATEPSPRAQNGKFFSIARVGWLTLGTAVVVIGLIGLFLGRRRSDSLQVHSLAVLPLENLSGDSGQEYFADGITEAIITDLGQIAGIRVISRHSVMQFKTGNRTLPQIASELTVDALVEGSVVRNGDRVRMTAQLVQMDPERHIWAASYERDAADIIAVQRDIADAVAREIRVTLNRPPGQVQTADTMNTQAYELYLRAREQMSLCSTTGFLQARDYLERAVSLDPNFASAYAGLAMTYTQLGF